MPLEKLSRTQLQSYRGGGGGRNEYVDQLRLIKPGDGGKIVLSKEKVTRQTAKNRLNAAATAAGIKIKFLRLRGNDDEVVFEVVS